MEEFRMAQCFRWKIILPATKRLGIDTSDHTLYERDAQRVWLGALNFKKSSDEREPLAETTEIVLRGSGYATEDEAVATAYRWRTVLELAFARRNIQADFGDRAPTGSGLSSAGIHMLEQQSARRVLNDAHATFRLGPTNYRGPQDFVQIRAASNKSRQKLDFQAIPRGNRSWVDAGGEAPSSAARLK
jgi:hypothetical protein